MSVYSILNENTDFMSDVDLSGIIECKTEPLMEGALTIVVEANENYNEIMKAVGISELAHFEKTGAELVYEGATASGFIAKAKAFFVNILEKIKGLFKKFFALLNSYVRSDKVFVEKYKKDILAAPTSGFKYKGYNFTLNAVDVAGADSKINAIIGTAVPNSTLTAAIADNVLAVNKSELIDKMYGAPVGESSLSRSDLFKELYKKLRNGEDSKQEISGVNTSDILSTITTAQDLIKGATKAYNDLENSIKDSIKRMDNFAKDLTNSTVKQNDVNVTDGNSKIIRAVHVGIDLLREKSNILQIVNGAKLTAIKDKNRQAKSIAVALVSYKPKKKDTDLGESVIEGSDFLSGVVLK